MIFDSSPESAFAATVEESILRQSETASFDSSKDGFQFQLADNDPRKRASVGEIIDMLLSRKDPITIAAEISSQDPLFPGSSQLNTVASKPDTSRGLMSAYGRKIPLDRPSRTVDDPLSLKYDQFRMKRSSNNDHSKEYINIPTSIVFGGSKSAEDFLKCCIGSLEDGMTKSIQMALIVAQRRVYGGDGRRGDTFQIYKSNEFKSVIKSVKVQSVTTKLGELGHLK